MEVMQVVGLAVCNSGPELQLAHVSKVQLDLHDRGTIEKREGQHATRALRLCG